MSDVLSRCGGRTRAEACCSFGHFATYFPQPDSGEAEEQAEMFRHLACKSGDAMRHFEGNGFVKALHTASASTAKDAFGWSTTLLASVLKGRDELAESLGRMVGEAMSGDAPERMALYFQLLRAVALDKNDHYHHRQKRHRCDYVQ